MKGRVEKRTKLNFHFIKEVRFYDRNNDVVANTMLYDVNGGYTHFEARAWHNLIFFFRSPMVACVDFSYFLCYYFYSRCRCGDTYITVWTNVTFQDILFHQFL